MRRICFAVICCLILLFSNAPAETKIGAAENIRCVTPSVKAALRNSGAVFAGEVLSESKNGSERTFEFLVKRYWKGAGKKKIKVSVHESARYQAWFEVGKSYLVFAGADEDGRLYDSRCSGSKLLSEASEDLKALGRAKIPR